MTTKGEKGRSGDWDPWRKDVVRELLPVPTPQFWAICELDVLSNPSETVLGAHPERPVITRSRGLTRHENPAARQPLLRRAAPAPNSAVKNIVGCKRASTAAHRTQNRGKSPAVLVKILHKTYTCVNCLAGLFSKAFGSLRSLDQASAAALRRLIPAGPKRPGTMIDAETGLR